MKFAVQEQSGVVLLRLEGPMIGGPDATLMSEKIHECIEAGKVRFLVDMSKVDWMNSSGLGILIGGLSTVRSRGGQLKLLHVGKKARSLLEITKLDRIFEMHDQEEAAIASFA
ncbi:MAG: STAS domain-containing protein [bacterium]|nr:STAS domain-containing protein [bacterium]